MNGGAEGGGWWGREELREEAGVEESFRRKLVRSRKKVGWTRRKVERIEGWGSGDDSETDGRRRKHKSATSGGARLSRTSGIKESNNY